MDAPSLWTTEPILVTNQQAYERVPGVTVPEEPRAFAKRDNEQGKQAFRQVADAVSIPFKSDILAETDRRDIIDTAGIEACSARYRSYRAEDNTYQPYGGGGRRLCELRNDVPTMESAQAGSAPKPMSASTMSDETAGTDALFAHERWCQARYASYDPATDTYQPFTGSRTACISPYN
ncbi:BA14K family protein [Rhizobium helianthi]|uniref:Lectin-like protein BA14k n=1 Tax=Rhizobium helianthi TaxID=1132695 RepID=A0ABW4M9Q6_9HYPH